MKRLLLFALLLLSIRSFGSNNALYFDADASVTGLSGVSPSQFTVEFWILLDYAGNLYQGVYWSANGSDERGIYVEQDHTISIWDQNIAQFNSASALPLQQWTHVAFSYDGTTLRIYINGNLVNTLTDSGLLLPTTNVTMGYGSGQYGDYDMANSALDEFRIWNVARTQSEIQADENIELSVPQAGLVRYYNFNQGVGGGNNTGVTSLPDVTGNSVGGTLNNFTLMGNTSNWVSDTGPLPLTLTSFGGYVSGQDVLLQWQTAQETGVQKFDIQKNIGGNQFLDVGEVDARDVPGMVSSYQWTDYDAASAEDHLYRLKMVDDNGNYSYSNVIDVRGGQSSSGLRIYYLNAASRLFGVRMPPLAPVGQYRLSIYNSSGSLVQVQQLDNTAYSNIYQVQLASQAMAPGIYTVVLNRGGYVLSRSLFVQ